MCSMFKQPKTYFSYIFTRFMNKIYKKIFFNYYEAWTKNLKRLMKIIQNENILINYFRLYSNHVFI